MNLDGTLRATVAADRLPLSEALDDEALIHRRLTLFYGCFALTATVASIVNRTRLVVANLDPHVVDFGLVKDLSAQTKITAEQSLAGTPLYLAPESILAPETVGPPADVYALGCVAYFLLTGRTPFDGTNLVAVCAAHVHEPPGPPSAHRPEVPPELDALVLRCLEKDAGARPTTRELETALAY